MGTRYQIMRKLGSGGMAEVYLARSTSAGGFEKWVALKQIKPELAQSREVRDLFLREVRLGASLDHPNLVQCFDGGSQGDQLYLVQEVVDGGDLGGVIRAMRRGGPRLSPTAVAHIGSQVCQALSFVFSVKDEAGRPLLQAHRDISPGNLLVTRAGQIKLGDFGVARLGESHTAVGVVRGKWEYFAPELARGVVDGRGDLFALSIVLYQLLGLRHPFAAETPQGHFERARSEPAQRPDGCPEPLWELLARGLARNVDERWPTSEAYAEALDAFVYAQGAFSWQALARQLEPLLPEPTPRTLDPRYEHQPALSFGQGSQPPEATELATELWQPEASLGPDGRLSAPPRPVPPAAPTCVGTEAPEPRQPGPASPPQLAQAPHLELASPVRPEVARLEPTPPARRRGVRPWLAGGVVLVALGGLGLAARALEGQPHHKVKPAAAEMPLPLVTIDSQPDAAEVYSGEELLGTTPLSIPNDYPEGTIISLRLRRRGYAPSDVSFIGSKAVRIQVALRKSH